MKLPNWNWKRVALIAVAGAAAVLAVRAFTDKGPKIEYDTQTVERGTLRQTVQVTGEVVSSADIDLKFEASGRVKSIAVKVGDAVKEGQMLASLDDRNERVRVQSANASRQSAQASLDRVLNGATAEDIRVSEVAVANAESALAYARESLEDAKASGDASVQKAYGDLDGQMETLFLKASSTMQTLKNDVYDASGQLRYDISSPDYALQSQALSAYTAAQASFTSMQMSIAMYRASVTDADRDSRSAALIADAKTIRDAAQLANALMQASVPTSGTTQASFDVRKADVRSAWIDMNAAVNASETQKLTIATTVASATSSVNAATQAVRTAEGQLESAKATLALKTAPATSYDVAAARASLAQASASLGEALLALDRTHIRAPFAGTIAAVPGRVGTTVTSADVILKLHGEDVYEVEAGVPETDIAKLRVGMKAEIKLDAYGEDVIFVGELASIDTAQTVIQDVVYYKTRFRFTTHDEEKPVRAGMTASVDVTTVEHPDALIVPQRAIREDLETGRKYVRILAAGVETRRDVEIGVRGDDGLIEILSGLSGGEEVILSIREDGEIKR
ncbi:MAG TPA: efflux RND transporter periplasmic adaptor subunit [Candidatus Baltobacteraceae bacterium]|nr:efflux RND transporter periplasmic adaptor subunit [Candidatus Baltobacteraceae bacterium]